MKNEAGNCLRCGKKLKNIPQKRKKIYCNSTCRSVLWIKNNRKKLREAKANVKEQSKKYVEY